MAQKRKRIAPSGRPASCVVRIQPHLSAALYRERLDGHYRDETEVVNAILRDWAKTAPAVDWPALKQRLLTEEPKDEPVS